MGMYGRQFKALDFLSPDETWRTDDDGCSEFLRRIDKAGEDGWQFHAMVDVDEQGRFIAVLRREEEDHR